MPTPRILDQHFEQVPAGSLKPHPANPRKGRRAIIRGSIEENGFYGACVVQRSTGFILVGNHRWQEVMEAGGPDQPVPVLWVDVDDVRARKIMAVDNRATDLAGYDEALQAELLRALGDDLAGTGYDEEDVGVLLARVEPPEAPAAPELGHGHSDLVRQYDAAEVRQIVLGYSRVHYGWVIARLAEIRERRGLDSNSAAIIALLADASGQQPPVVGAPAA